MTRLLLHIGQHKTGTTSLQVTLHQAQAAGLLGDVLYCRTPMPNHSYLISAVFSETKHSDYHRNLKAGLDIPRHRRMLKAGKSLLDEEIKAAKNANQYLLIIAEDFCALHPDEISKAKDYFRGAGIDTFEITGYIRPVRSFANSYANQMVKQGCSIESILRTPPTPRYRDAFEKFVDVFGRDTVNIRPFNPSLFRGQSLLQDFISTAKLPIDPESIEEIRRNESISFSLARCLSFFHKMESDESKFYQAVGKLPLKHEHTSRDEEMFVLSEAALTLAVQSSQADIDWACDALGVDRSFLEKSAPSIDEAELSRQPSQGEMLDMMLSRRRQFARSNKGF